MAAALASWMLDQEARALLTRLDRFKSFALSETMVPAAALTFEAQGAIDAFLSRERLALRRSTLQFLQWLSGEGRFESPEELQRRFTFLRLRFNTVIAHFDIFSEALSQRSEADTGVLLAGLDVVSKDALGLPGVLEAPPVICYLARGPGAAIRRAHTRLPGGGNNPVALVRIPRERMVGSAIASSLVHEVGHQAAALLGLLPSLRSMLPSPSSRGAQTHAWDLWARWLSEIAADLWSVGRVGVTSTLGLMGVLSLPRAFVFRVNEDGVHPMPWIRVALSAAIGQTLYPHPQWQRLTGLWEQLYPLDRLDDTRRGLVASLRASIPDFVSSLVEHRPPALGGRSLREAFEVEARQPARLQRLYQAWCARPSSLGTAPPSLVFAVIGQARADGRITPEQESAALAEFLRAWALRSTLDASAVGAIPRRPRLARGSWQFIH